jgi:hypothetical protein
MRKANEESTRLATKRKSRRAIASATDHVFCLISAASKTWKAIEDDCGADDATHCRLAGANWAAVDKIVAHEPRTLAGIAASLRFFESRMDIDALRDQERMQAVFANLAAAAEQIAGERLS